MGSEKEEYIKPVDQQSGEQLELGYDHDELSEFNVVMAALIKRMGDRLASHHNQEYFGFKEIEGFAYNIDRSTQEAGKIFTRFYNGLEEYGVKLPNPDYEENRDKNLFPLALLSFVLSEKPEDQDDAYDTLLRVFYSQKMGRLVVKQSTST